MGDKGKNIKKAILAGYIVVSGICLAIGIPSHINVAKAMKLNDAYEKFNKLRKSPASKAGVLT